LPTRYEPKAMPAAIHSAKVSKIPGAISRNDLRPAGQQKHQTCDREAADGDQAVERLETGREVQHRGPYQRGQNDQQGEG
jgi:hypothetical protein